jgi:hypothetical protein
MRLDRRTDMKLTVAFRNFANAPDIYQTYFGEYARKM